MVRRHPGLQRALRGASRGPAGPSWLGWFVALGIWSIWVRRGLVWPVPSGTAPAVLQAREGASCLQSVGGDVGLGAPGESRGGCLCCPQEPGERPGQVRGGRAHSGNAVCAALPPPDTTWLESPPVGPLTRIRGARPVDLLSVFSAGRAGGGTREGAPRTLQHWAPSCRWKGSQGGTGRGDAQAPGPRQRNRPGSRTGSLSPSALLHPRFLLQSRGELVVVSGPGHCCFCPWKLWSPKFHLRGLSVFPESWFCCNKCSFWYGLDGWLCTVATTCSRTVQWKLCHCFLVLDFGGSLVLATFKFLRFCC